MAEENWDELRQRLIGFGEQSSRKSYFPELQRKLAELKESEQRFRILVENSSDVIFVLDANGVFRFVSPAYEKHFGYPITQVLQKNFALFIHPEDLQLSVEHLKKVINTGEASTSPVCRIKHLDGSWRSFVASGSVYLEPSGSPRYLGIGRDISDQIRAEEERLNLERQLLHAQKLESLGVLSGGIAHDFNNILAIIIGYCGLTKMNYETAEKNIPIIETAAERAAGLCRQMLAYAGKAQLTKTKVNMVKKVDEIVGMLKASLPQNAVIKSDFSAEIPFIEGDASQLRQVIMNLIINASEAIGTEHGEVRISLASIKVRPGKSYEDYHGKAIPPGQYVCLEVTDNGCGMDEATKWRIFEPFYTTKFTGRGLGMSAVLGIIKSHGGALQLFSQLGHGTTFKIFLPALTSDAAGDEDQTASVPSTTWQGSGTILLVEDEDEVRHIAKELLEIFGFTVLVAVNGEEALEMYRHNGAEITLVVTDMGMPVMDGYEMFHKLKSLNPELPIIISSGYGDVEVSSRIGSDNIAGLINKPYNPDQLRDVLKGVLEGKV